MTRWLTYASDDLSIRPAVIALKTRTAANPNSNLLVASEFYHAKATGLPSTRWL
jgi:hypothetical protein